MSKENKEKEKTDTTGRIIDLDKLLDFLVASSGLKAIIIKLLEGAIYNDSQKPERYQIEIQNGPMSDYQSYKARTIADAFKSFLSDIYDLAEERLESARRHVEEAAVVRVNVVEEK